MKRLGVVMDPIGSIQFKKDSTLAMLLEAQRRGLALFYFELGDLYVRDGRSFGTARRLRVFDDPAAWYSFEGEETVALGELDWLFMRKDPPFDMEYIYATYILEGAEREGAVVVNRPQALRDTNEKLSITWFPQCIPPTLVTHRIAQLRDFLEEQGEIVLKPLDVMGGRSIFRLRRDDPNAAVIFDTVTAGGRRLIMAQRFLPEIRDGDRRLMLIDGEALPLALVRVPQGADWRGNLAAGAEARVEPLRERDQWICRQVGARLRDMGHRFVGLDVIGDHLTEINVTSPTGIRELAALGGLDVAARLFDALGVAAAADPSRARPAG